MITECTNAQLNISIDNAYAAYFPFSINFFSIFGINGLEIGPTNFFIRCGRHFVIFRNYQQRIQGNKLAITQEGQIKTRTDRFSARTVKNVTTDILEKYEMID